jgi:hypothetical protein
MEARTDEYLLDRQQGARRYGMSVRGLEDMYKRHPDFPIIRRGRKVLIHRKLADEWFDAYVGKVIDME